MNNWGPFCSEADLFEAAKILQHNNLTLDQLMLYGFLQPGMVTYRYQKMENGLMQKTPLTVVAKDNNVFFSSVPSGTPINYVSEDDHEFYVGEKRIRLDQLKSRCRDRIRTQYIVGVRELCDGSHADLEKTDGTCIPRVIVGTQKPKSEILEQHSFLKNLAVINYEKPNKFFRL
jgi:hypothetical protein